MIYWYHLTDGDLSRAHRVIDAFREEDTVDVLGFQRISDPFDDWFYPAVTTPMTRARYYLFVPAIYRIVESRRIGYQAARALSKKLQVDLQEILKRTEPGGRGVIGRRSGPRLRRQPSAIYWSALGKLGIRLPVRGYRNLHEADYLSVVTGRRPLESFETDDGVDEEPVGRDVWDSKLPLTRILKNGVRLSKDLSLALPKAEADYLGEKFLNMPGGEDSLLGVRLKLGLSAQFEYPWDVTKESKVPDGLVEKLAHARSLSAAARAMTLVYHHLVVEAQVKRRLASPGARDQAEALREEFRFWWSNARRFVSTGWNLGAFRRIAAAACGEDDLRDLSLLVEVVRSSSGAAECFESGVLREAVVAREARKRPSKCRLCGRPAHLKFLKHFDVSAQVECRAFQLRYRHHRGDTIVRDLLRQPYKKRGDVQD